MEMAIKTRNLVPLPRECSVSVQRFSVFGLCCPLAPTISTTQISSQQVMTIREVLCYWGREVHLSRPLPTPWLAHGRHCCTET